MTDLEAEAANPGTSPLRLQELANGYPRLRPLIAMNPTAYPALVQWLTDLNDPAVNVALAQRSAASGSPAGGPRRISVMGREDVMSATPPSEDTASRPAPITEPPPGGASNGQPAASVAVENHSLSGAAAAPSPSRGRGGLLIALVALAAIVLVFLLLFVTGRPPFGGSADTGEGNADTAGQVESGGAQADTASPEESAPGNQDSEPQVVYPAPAGALALDHFVSPSGNIACQIGADSVTCTINSHEFVDPEAPTCGTGPLSLTASADQAGLDCSTNLVSASGAATLSYMDYAASGDFVCASSEFGVSCWNTVTGVGFGVAREGYQITASGQIDASKFPWN